MNKSTESYKTHTIFFSSSEIVACLSLRCLLTNRGKNLKLNPVPSFIAIKPSSMPWPILIFPIFFFYLDMY